MTQQWDQILEKARTSESKDWLYAYLDELCTTPTLEDPTKLKVLGNSLANSENNREFLLKSGFAKELLRPDALCLTVLINYCIDFPQGCNQLLLEYSDQLHEALVATTDAARASAKHLTGVLAQEVDMNEVPIETRVRIVLDGFIELVLVDESLEVNETLLSHFSKIYAFALDLEDFNDATQVIGNISSHSNLTLEFAKGIEPAISPVFFIVLANLTGKLTEVESVMIAFPDALQLCLDFIDSDDFEHDEFNSCAHFLRNVGRVEQYAGPISECPGFVPLVEDLIESPFAEVAVQLVGIIGQHICRPDLFEVLGQVKEDPSVNAALLVSYSQLCIPLGTTTDTVDINLEPVVKKIIELLESTPALDQTLSLWLKGSKALALLSRHTSIPDVEYLRESAPEHEGITQNFAFIAANSK